MEIGDRHEVVQGGERTKLERVGSKAGTPAPSETMPPPNLIPESPQHWLALPQGQASRCRSLLSPLFSQAPWLCSAQLTLARTFS